MYSREESSRIRKEFWTKLGQYLAPIPGAEGLKVNWLNYKTGYSGLYFRMDADRGFVEISVEMAQRDPDLRHLYFEQFQELKAVLHHTMEEEWIWLPQYQHESGKEISKIYCRMEGVNIFNESDWPKMISFLKPRMIVLDEFWNMAQDHFLDLKSF